jgi:hypothetical protein
MLHGKKRQQQEIDQPGIGSAALIPFSFASVAFIYGMAIPVAQKDSYSL